MSVMYIYSMFVIKTTIWKYQRILRSIGDKLVARDMFWPNQIGTSVIIWFRPPAFVQ